jgi:hypothetical protein
MFLIELVSRELARELALFYGVMSTLRISMKYNNPFTEHLAATTSWWRPNAASAIIAAVISGRK